MREVRALSSEFSRTMLVVCLALGVIVLFASIAFFEFTLTGRVAGDFVIEKALAGESIEGTFLYRVGEAGALPLDSEVVLSVNTLTKRLSLRQVVDPIFLDKTQEIEFAPYLEVMIALSDVSPVKSGSGGKGSASASSSGGGSASSVASPVDEGGESPPGAPGEAVSESGVTAAAVIAEVITGERVLRVRYGEDVEVSVPEGKFARIESVVLRGQKVDNSFASLTQSGTSARVGSLYTEKVEGFSDPEMRVPLDLGAFDFITPRKWADLHISFIFKGENIASSERSVIVESESVPEGVKPVEGVPGESEGIPGEEPVCGVQIVCGPYSACASPAFDGLVALDEALPDMMQSRTCYDEACGTTFTDTQLCVVPSTRVDIESIPDDGLDENSDVPLDIPRQPERASSSARTDPSVHLYTEQDLLLYGSVTRELEEEAEIVVNVRGSEHSVSLLSVKDGRVRIRVASTPQEAEVIEGETRVFDLDGDRNYDLSVSVIRVRGDSAVVSVAPYEGTRENPLAPGEEGVAIINEKLSAPVAHVILDKDIPTLRVLLMQSAKRYPIHCYNMIKDINEAGADCGGPDCRACREEEKEYGAVVWWILSLVSALLLALIVRVRRASLSA